MCILFGARGTHQARPDQFMFILMFEVARPGISSVQKKKFDDYIFTIPMEVNGKNTTEPEHKDEFDEK